MTISFTKRVLDKNIPAYGDHNAPKGNWYPGSKDGPPLFPVKLEVFIVDETKGDPDENLKFRNQNGYYRCWAISPANTPVSFSLGEAWLEGSHLKPLPVPPPTSEDLKDWTICEVKIFGLTLTIELRRKPKI